MFTRLQWIVGPITKRSVAIGLLLAGHERLLHSSQNVLLEQGGLFGQDLVPYFLQIPEPFQDRQPLVPTLNCMLYERLTRDYAIGMLDSLTSRHDRRVAQALLDQFVPMTFRMLLMDPDNPDKGLSNGIRVIRNLAGVNDDRIRHQLIKTLQETGTMDVLVKNILMKVRQRSGTATDVRTWIAASSEAAIQFVREREMSIEALAKLLEDPSFRDSLLRDFDGCFLDPSSIRSCLNGGDDPAVSLVAALPSMAIGASGRRNAANAQRTILHALRSRYPADDPRVQQLEEAWLRNSDQNISGRHRVVSFIMPQHEQGVQITSERMKLAGCFGSMTSLLGVVCGLRSRPAWKAMIGTGVGAAALVFWNDLFIHWDRFFDRDVLPKFDRSTPEDRRYERLWSGFCQTLHLVGNFVVINRAVGAWIPYFLISSSHFAGELNLLARLGGASPPGHRRLFPGGGPYGDI